MIKDAAYWQARGELEEALVGYCTRVDALADAEAIAGCFTGDAMLDLTGLKMGQYQGREQITAFYDKVFRTMSHHMHMMTNFRVEELTETSARCIAYVAGMGQAISGESICVYVYYDLDFRRMGPDWKIARFYEAPQLPMPSSVNAVHGEAANDVPGGR